MTAGGRVTDYDRIADRFDTRYRFYRYDGVRETLVNFLGPEPNTVLEVGCGTGHWLAAVPGRSIVAGVDPSAPMLAVARVASPSAHLVRSRAEDLPWRDAAFDRVFCVNALQHFTDRHRFFAEARRVLKPGGGLLTIGMDPHTDRDQWWVYEYFEEMRALDRERFARTESMEADHVEVVRQAAELFADGTMTSRVAAQLTVLSDEEFGRGAARLRQASEAAGGELQLVADFRLYATIGWV